MSSVNYPAKSLSGLNPADFKSSIHGKQTDLFILKNKNGLEMCVTNFGGIVVSLLVPDKTGTPTDVVLGHKSIADYLNTPEKYLGAAIGRYGNRIKNSRFTLDGKEYRLTPTNSHYTLHGGKTGYNNVVWDAVQKDEQTLELTYVSPDGDEGFPGTLSIRMIYRLTDRNEFKIDYEAETDKPTVVNLTQHSFFNLNGEGSGDVLDHVVTIDADFFTPNDENSTPTGEILTVKDTPMDFLSPHAIGERIDQDFQQLVFGAGYDHNYVLNKKEAGELTWAAQAVAPKTGITLDVFTTEPGVQIYTGNWLNGFEGKNGHTYPRRTAVCFETQHFPDSPNKPHFPTTVLRPGQRYGHTCVYQFGTKK